MNQKRIIYILRTLWLLFAMGIIGLPTIFLMVKNDSFGGFGGFPSIEDLERPTPELSSELISADGVSLGKYFRKNRTDITYDSLSPELINTLLVTEDIRFKKHSGIDLRSLSRAILGTLTLSFQGGASTLTMQLAENLFNTNNTKRGSLYKNRTLGQIITKIKEWIIAVQLERAYTKEEILALYLNTIEFGSNSYGIKVATKTFFNKLPSQLTYSESAILVGSINAPTRWSPILNPANAKRKKTEVLWNLYKYGVIDRIKYDILNKQPIHLNYQIENHNQGLATYFRTIAKKHLVNWSLKNGYDLFEDGLKIYTTIDSRMQKYAEEAVKEHTHNLQKQFNEHWGDLNPWIDEKNNEIPLFLENAIKRTDSYKYLHSKFGNEKDSIEYYLHKKKRMKVFSWNGQIDTLLSSYDSINYYKRFLQAGFMSMDPRTGFIKAWVGGINHRYFKFDHVKQGKRQPGSTFKPIVYTAAIDNGYSPCFPVVDAPVSFNLPNQTPSTWIPQNSSGRFSGEVMTIREAMAKSVNSITAFMMNRIEPETVTQYAKKLGIKSPLAAVPALCLGAGGDVSIYEMVGAYSTFVNKGTFIEPFFISKIEDKNGNIIQEFVPNEQEAINEETAYLMLHMLKGVVELGTGKSLNFSLKENNDIGAKTGTTQNASDGWFIGTTKNLVSGAWVGGDDRSIRFKNWTMGQGGRTAMPIWEKYMLKVYADKNLGYEKGYFEKPTTPLKKVIDCKLYKNLNSSDTINYNHVDEDDFM